MYKGTELSERIPDGWSKHTQTFRLSHRDTKAKKNPITGSEFLVGLLKFGNSGSLFNGLSSGVQWKCYKDAVDEAWKHPESPFNHGKLPSEWKSSIHIRILYKVHNGILHTKGLQCHIDYEAPFQSHYPDMIGGSMSLKKGEYLKSKNGKYFLVQQSDGNLVGYVNKSALPKEKDRVYPENLNFVPENAFWSSHTNGKGESPHRFTIQEDGNAVIYDKHNKPMWATGTNKKGKLFPKFYRLIMQNDRNIVLYDGQDKPIWASKTKV